MNIDYQSGSIVSKVLLKKRTGSVTAFAFDAGQELSEHTAPFDALVVMLEGEMHITIGGELHIVAADASLLMPANIPHALKAPGRAKMMLVMIRDEV